MHVHTPTESAWRAAPRYALTGSWLPPAGHLAGISRLRGCGDSCGCGGRCSDGLGDFVSPPAWSTTATAQNPVTADDALNQAESGESSPDFPDPTWWQQALADIAAGQMTLDAAGCQGQPAANVNMFSTASGLALGTTSVTTGILSATGVIGAATGVALGAATAGVGLLVSVIGMIFAHHAAAVRQEQALECSMVPAANNALTLIAQAVAAGQTTAAAAAGALDTIYSQAAQYVAPAVKHNPCNANCEWLVILKAITIYQKAMYNAMPTSASGAIAPGGTAVTTPSGTTTTVNPATGAVTTTPSGTLATIDPVTGQITAVPAAAPASGIPTWAWLAAAGIAAFMVLK
jgi:hypothetical protein